MKKKASQNNNGGRIYVKLYVLVRYEVTAGRAVT